MADLLGIGLSALLAQQRALATTSNNVANASTPGYSRQRTELSERPTEQLGPYFAGKMADVTQSLSAGTPLSALTNPAGSKELFAIGAFGTILHNPAIN